MTLRRITPDECEFAYREIGRRPLRHGWVDSTGRECCGMAAVLLVRLAVSEASLSAAGQVPGYGDGGEFEVASGHVFGHDYASGFIQGFDGDDSKEREVTIKLKFARTRDQEVSIAVECSLKTPAYATQKTQARMKSMGEQGLGVLFQPMAPENVDQETMYPVED